QPEGNLSNAELLSMQLQVAQHEGAHNQTESAHTCLRFVKTGTIVSKRWQRKFYCPVADEASSACRSRPGSGGQKTPIAAHNDSAGTSRCDGLGYSVYRQHRERTAESHVWSGSRSTSSFFRCKRPVVSFALPYIPQDGFLSRVFSNGAFLQGSEFCL